MRDDDCGSWNSEMKENDIEQPLPRRAMCSVKLQTDRSFVEIVVLNVRMSYAGCRYAQSRKLSGLWLGRLRHAEVEVENIRGVNQIRM